MKDLIEEMTASARGWAANSLAEIEHEWGRLGNAHIDEGIEKIRTLVKRLNDITINTTGLN